MAQIDFENLTTDWVAFTDITTPADDTDYFIQNRGPDNLLAVESASEPSSLDGVLVQPYKTLVYKKGTDTLYLRAYSSNCAINISSEG